MGERYIKINGTSELLVEANPTGDRTIVLPDASGTLAVSADVVATNAARIQALYDGANSISSGTISLANANGVSFSINGQTISGSIATTYAGTGFTSAGANISMSGTLNTAGFSFSASVAAQTNQTLGIYGSSQTIGSASSATYDARSISIIGAGIVSVGNHSTNGGTTNGFIISATQSNQAISGSNGSFAFQTVTFGSSNGLHFYTTNGSIVGSYTVPTVTNSSWTVSDNATSATVGRLAFTQANGITMSLSTSNNGNHTVFASHNAITSQTNQTLGGYFVGNTTAQSSSSTFDARTLSIEAGGILSAGWSNGSMRFSAYPIISAPGGTSTVHTIRFLNNEHASFTNLGGGIQITSLGATWIAQGNTTIGTSGSPALASLTYSGAGIVSVGVSNESIFIVSATQSNQAVSNSAGSFTFQTLNFSDANNVTWGTSAGGIITASVAAPGAAAEANWHHLLGANTAGNTTASGSTIGLSGINVTLSGTNGSVINVSGPARYTASGWNPYEDLMIVLTTNQGSLLIDAVDLPYMQYDRVAFPFNFTNATNSSGTHTLSFWVGVYTRNVSTLSLLASASTQTTVTGSGTVGNYSLHSGLRLFTIPMTTTLTEGRYWLGFVSRTTTGGGNASYSLAAVSQLGSNFLGHFGVAHNTTYQFALGQGVYNTTTSGIPNSIGFNQIRGSDLAVLRPAYLMFVSSTV